MFENLSERLESAFKQLKGEGRINEINVATTVKEIRRALVDADVNYKIAKEFTDNVKEKAMGEKVITSVSPGQLMVKIVKDELVALMGGREEELDLSGKPTVILIAGLQGSGKTTTTGKLALRLKDKQRKKVLVASLDIYRPAAQEQKVRERARLDDVHACRLGQWHFRCRTDGAPFVGSASFAGISATHQKVHELAHRLDQHWRDGHAEQQAARRVLLAERHLARRRGLEPHLVLDVRAVHPVALAERPVLVHPELRDDEHRQAAVTDRTVGVGTGEHHEDVGAGTERAPRLDAVDDIALDAVLGRRSGRHGDAGDVGSEVGLGHGDSVHDLGRRELGKPLVLLFLCAAGLEGPGEDLGAGDQRTAGAEGAA